MTLALVLAHLVCPDQGVGTGDGTVDPLAPLILGDQTAQNYSTQTYDLVGHKWKLQVVWQKPDFTFAQGDLTFATDGTFLINGIPIEQIPGISAAVTAANVSASQAAASATASGTARDAAVQAQNNATASASSSNDSAVISSNNAATAQTSANQAATVVQSSRLIPTSGPVGGTAENYSASFLNTRRRANPSGLLTVTIPQNIYVNSAEAKEAWGSYRLESAGSVKFAGAAGGSVAVPATNMFFGRSIHRVASVTTGPLTHTFTMDLPAVTDGRLVVIGHGIGSGGTRTMGITSTPTLTWTTKKTFPAAAAATREANYAIFEATLTSFPATTMSFSVTQTGGVDSMMLDVYVIGDPGGAMVLPVTAAENVIGATVSSTLAGLVAGSLVIASSVCRGSPNSATVNSFVSFSNIPSPSIGSTVGENETAAANTNNFKNMVFGDGTTVASASGDRTTQATFQTASFAPDLALMAYPPKTTTVLGMDVQFLGGPTHDTLTALNGEAQLWFDPGGQRVFIAVDT
jgi:hypothetical protein